MEEGIVDVDLDGGQGFSVAGDGDERGVAEG